MPNKIFQIDTSIHPTCESYSRRGGQHFIRKFQEKFGQLEVSYLDLTRNYPSLYYLEAMCSSNIWLWCLSAEVTLPPSSFMEWINFIHQKNFSLSENCSFPKKTIIISTWHQENDELAPKFNAEPLVRHNLNLLGVDDVKFFHLFQKDNNANGEIKLQNSINNYIAGLQL